jgi:aryl-phospho-beta-D-glucosidase BglC (GH1 family)
MVSNTINRKKNSLNLKELQISDARSLNDSAYETIEDFIQQVNDKAFSHLEINSLKISF